METEKSLDYNQRRHAESKESQAEKQEDQEAKKAAARERAEQFAREAQNTKKMMANIMANMQQVVLAVQAIRRQLQLQDDGSNIPSIARDKQVYNTLKRKLMNLQSQMADLKSALLQEEIAQMRKEYQFMTQKEVEVEAAKRVEDTVARLGLT